MMDKLLIAKNHIYKITICFLLLSLVIFNARNFVRINKEINLYNYDIINSPFFFIEEDVDTYPISQFQDTTLYSLKNGGYCWATTTPCSYSKSVKIKEYFWMKMFYKDSK